MLQRAASNAYSWWWASHIRTKQSKWLEQNLQDVEDRVKKVLTILEEDGDSFAKRAEMYYKKRPELINFVEESYRAYRALAERYDHISTELQNANNTIAAVCPEQVQFAMDEEDDDGAPRIPRKMPEVSKANIPQVPKALVKDLKTANRRMSQPKKAGNEGGSLKASKSSLSKPEALEEIDKLQKEILALQTTKEFVKSSYENGLARYWEIEKQIEELQDKVCSLQDEFGEGIAIEDDEARHLMAEAALKSCQETLVKLQEKQEKSAQEASAEFKRIKDSWQKLDSLKSEFNYSQNNEGEISTKDVKQVQELKSIHEDIETMTQQRQELQLLQDKIKEHLGVGTFTPLSVTEMAEKIDELVNKVLSLETAISSQTSLVKRLRTETDELQAQIRNLEDDKTDLINDKENLNKKLREMEEKLHRIQDLNQILENQNSNLHTHFTEARCNLDQLYEQVESVKPDEGLGVRGSTQIKEETLNGVKMEKMLDQQDVIDVVHDTEEVKGVKSDKELEVTQNSQNDGPPVEMRSLQYPKEEERTKDLQGNNHERAMVDPGSIEESKDISQSEDSKNIGFLESSQDLKPQESDAEQSLPQTKDNLKANSWDTTTQEEPDWRQLFMSGMQNREKALLTEYTITLRNYNDVKKKLSEIETKSQECPIETSAQIKDLKSANAMKDEEIKLLRQKLSLLQRSLDGSEYQQNSRIDEQIYEGEKSSLMENPTAAFSENDSSISAIEEKLRMNIDQLLEENLDFWLKFSTSFHEIQKFETEIEDLQAEVLKLEERAKKPEGDSGSIKYSLKSDARPIYKHLIEIQAKIAVWLEKSVVLKEELKSGFSSLCNIQEEITQALKASAEDDDFKFTSYQAAKFQGEVLNMKQENNKVADELQAGSDHMTMLQVEVEKAMAKLDQQFDLSGSKKQQSSPLRHSVSRSRVPLRSFIFGVKSKKQKQSIFSCMTPTMHRKYQGFRPLNNL